MKSSILELNNNTWVKALDNQTGTIIKHGFGEISFIVNVSADVNRALILPEEGIHFASKVTVWVKQYTHTQRADCGVIK